MEAHQSCPKEEACQPRPLCLPLRVPRNAPAQMHSSALCKLWSTLWRAQSEASQRYKTNLFKHSFNLLGPATDQTQNPRTPRAAQHSTHGSSWTDEHGQSTDPSIRPSNPPLLFPIYNPLPVVIIPHSHSIPNWPALTMVDLGAAVLGSRTRNSPDFLAAVANDSRACTVFFFITASTVVLHCSCTSQLLLNNNYSMLCIHACRSFFITTQLFLQWH